MRSIRPSLAVVFALMLAAPAAAQSEQVPLEVMRAEAEAAIAKRHSDIEKRVGEAVGKFAMTGSIIGGDDLERTRSSLVALGAAATPTIMRYFSTHDRERVLDQLALVLSEMLDEGAVEGESLVDDLSPHIRSTVTPRSVAAIRVLGKSGVESLKDEIRSLIVVGQKSEILAAAIEALGHLGDDQAFDKLEAALDHASAAVRRAAVETYGRVGRIQDVGLVISRLDDRDDAVAYAAIEALERMASSTKAMRALHDQLEHADTRRIRLTIDVLKRIGNAELSRRYLREVVSKRKESDFETAKQAAIALYTMRDASGRDELAKSFKRTISKNAKVPRYRVNLANFYLEFGDYKSAVSEFSKAINLEKNVPTQDGYRVMAARCYSRLGKLRNAADLLKKVYGDDWTGLVVDPDFEKMREDRRYADNFLPPHER